jgi:hypothetical protein
MIGAMPPRVKLRWRRSRRRGSENKLPGSRHLHFHQTFPVAAAITFGFAALFFYLEPYPVSAFCRMMIGVVV